MTEGENGTKFDQLPKPKPRELLDDLPRGEVIPVDQPSVERLKHLLFGREVPREYATLIEAAGRGFEFGGAEPTRYSEALAVYIQDRLADEFEGSALRWERDPAQFPEDELTDFGKFVRSRMQGHPFIDLGSGPNSPARTYAAIFGAQAYIGVDIDLGKNPLSHEANKESAERVGVAALYTIQDDMLSFVSKVRDGFGATYFLSGIEVQTRTLNNGDKLMRKYLSALAQEMVRTMKSGDVIILGRGTEDFLKLPEPYGLEPVTFDATVADRSVGPLHIMRVYKKKG